MQSIFSPMKNLSSAALATAKIFSARKIKPNDTAKPERKAISKRQASAKSFLAAPNPSEKRPGSSKPKREAN